MKKKFILVFCLLPALLSHAQDIVTMSDGKIFNAHIVNITKDSIGIDSLSNGILFRSVLPKSDLFSVFFENGTQMYFTEKSRPALIADTIQNANRYEKGRTDASQTYTNYKAAGTGTFFASAVFPVLGLIPAIACSTTPPKSENLNLTDSLQRDADYFAGYQKQAWKIKSRKVWSNYGIGAGVGVGARILFVIGLVSLVVTSID